MWADRWADMGKDEGQTGGLALEKMGRQIGGVT